ncbi:hypothetical protein N185_16960 [Sinorhizobium sp. GW3]|nr:hypothetical protein N185_16960 [Sinorhizobium sp. GW3]
MRGRQNSIDPAKEKNGVVRMQRIHEPDSLGILKRARMRPTQQRLLLVSVLFSGSRHVSADSLYRELVEAGSKLPLATIYNSLNSLAKAGVLRKVVVNSGKVYFDTNTGDHQHFFIEAENRIVDIPAEEPMLKVLPPAPAGYEIVNVDILVRLKPK